MIRREYDLCYLAGLFDGEGSIYLYLDAGRFKHPQVWLVAAIAMCEPEGLEIADKLFPGHKVKARQKHKRTKQGYVYYWKVQGKKAYEFSKIMTNYCRVKRRQLELAAQWWESREHNPGRRRTQEEIAVDIRYWKELKEAKGRGTKRRKGSVAEEIEVQELKPTSGL